MQVLSSIANDVKEIFTEIYNGPEQFPIESVGGYNWRSNGLGSNHSSGTAIDIKHTAATPCGMAYTASARLTGREGRCASFEVWAEDEIGEIGRGSHTRVVVDAKRFQEKADAKRRLNQ